MSKDRTHPPPSAELAETEVAASGEAALARTVETTDPGAAATSAALPATIGRYLVRRRLGAGGMGVVYAGHDPQLDRPVAIKVLHERATAREHLAERLHREARALAKVTHPNVVSVYDVGIDGGEVYVVMQLVDGDTLDRALAVAPADRRRTLALFAAAGRGLSAAHAADLVHRDFKPSNVLVDRDGTVRVTDFGLARVSNLADVPVPETGEISLSMTRGELVGTPAYMAPEQFSGGPITAATDQFSFCVALWEALAGERPFAGDSIATVRDAVLAGAVRVPPPDRRLPARLDRILRRGLAVVPADRWPSMDALLAALAPPRHRVAIGLGVALAVVGGAVATWLAMSSGRAAPRAVAAADAAPPSRPATPPSLRPLTTLGGCAFTPNFLDEDTVVFDLTRDGAVDLYRVDLGGAAPVPITTEDGWEWNSARGASASEILFIGTGTGVQLLEALDLATGARRTLATPGGVAAYANGAYYYSPQEQGVLRRVRDAKEEIVLAAGPGEFFENLAVSPDQRRIVATLYAAQGVARLCTIELDAPVLRCVKARPGDGRMAFSTDGRAVYFNNTEGVHRVELATEVITHLSSDVDARGGITISPSGRTMVVSSCGAKSELFDVAADPDHPLVDDRDIDDVVVGPGGVIAYVRDLPTRVTIVLRAPDGSLRDLVSRDEGRITSLAFSADGERLAYVVGDPADAGIYVTGTSPGPSANRITELATDDTPVFVGDDLVFVRWSPDHSPQLMRVGPGGSDERLVGSRPRRIVGVELVGGRVLLASPGKDFLYWWDPATGRERPGPRLRGPVAADLALSPDGRWLMVLSGENGDDIGRMDLHAAHPELESVHRLPDGVTALVGAIDDRGHPIIPINTWSGELWSLTAPDGKSW